MPQFAIPSFSIAFRLTLLAVLLYGLAVLSYWTDRSIWIDEASQLLNYPLSSLGEAFVPLPQVQQAAPPAFNLLFHAISDLSIQGMRITVVSITLGVIAITLFSAFIGKPLAVAAGLFVLFTNSAFLMHATMLKFYAFEIAGFAVLATWVYGKSLEKPFGFYDAVVVLFGMLLGVSTLIGAFAAVLSFLGLRLVVGRLTLREAALGAVVCVAALGYYLQIQYATSIQIAAFPDAYGGQGAEAVRQLVSSVYGVFGGRRGAVLLVAMTTFLVAALFLLRGSHRLRIAGLLLFGTVIAITIVLLAALGAYPATSGRHVVWSLGVFCVLAAATVSTLMHPDIWTMRALALGGSVAFLALLAAVGLREAQKWPPRVIEGSSEYVIAKLSALPASTVLLYMGGNPVIQLALQRGAQIDHHHFAPLLSLSSGLVDQSYFSDGWMDAPENELRERIAELLNNDPVGLNKAWIILRLRGDYWPMAEYVLDHAPRDGSIFYVTSPHLSWSRQSHPRVLALTGVLDDRGCEYTPVAVFETPLSPGFVLESRCPAIVHSEG